MNLIKPYKRIAFVYTPEDQKLSIELKGFNSFDEAEKVLIAGYKTLFIQDMKQQSLLIKPKGENNGVENTKGPN
jgi:hypothetical protein